jgi:hypothetical protein
MIKVFVTSPEIRELKGEGKVTGKPYHMRFQTGHAFTVDAAGKPAEFPDKFEMILETDQLPFARGEYLLHPSAFSVGRDGKPEFRARLAPIAGSSAKG